MGGRSNPAPVNWLFISLFGIPGKTLLCRGSSEDKGCRVYPLNPCPDALVLCSGCTPGKHRAWYLSIDRHTPYLVGLFRRWKHARMKLNSCLWIQIICALAKALFCPILTLQH
ncbi:hypothetical protein TNCV_3061951 [Trichonephila clavipes]|nr:hypothetical protein TNCV_3061951 [Trichonephila clavipes]